MLIGFGIVEPDLEIVSTDESIGEQAGIDGGDGDDDEDGENDH